jgi:hypothetical protein
MKKLLLFLVAVMATLLAMPTAHAYDKVSWHDSEKILRQLNIRMDALRAKRDRFGATPRQQGQFARLRAGLDDLTARVVNHGGDPKTARDIAESLSDQASVLESEYPHHHEEVVVHVYQN